MIPLVYPWSQEHHVRILVTLAVYLIWSAQAVAQDTVLIKDILQTWEKTAVRAARCKVVQRAHMPGGRTAAFGSQVRNLPESNRKEEFRFAYVFDQGMRLDNLTRDQKENSTREGGISLMGTRGGVTQVIEKPPGQNTLLWRAEVGALMCWLEPSITTYGNELRSVARSISRVRLVESDEFGDLAHIELPTKTRLTLAKSLDWRPLAMERAAGGESSPMRMDFVYERNKVGGELVLKSWTFVGELGGRKSESAGKVSEVEFTANLSDIQLAIPGRSLVRNVATNDEYLVMSDGNKRPILDTERANRIHVNTLLATEPGEAVRAGPASYLAWWIMALGLAILATGVGLAFWRSAKIK